MLNIIDIFKHKLARFNAAGTALLGPQGNEHATLGARILTVGDTGRFAKIRDAIDYINAQTYQETLHSGSYAYADGAKVLTASANISSLVTGRQLFLKHSTDDFLYPITVTNPGSTEFKSFYPMYGRTSGSLDFSIISPTAYWVIYMLPGRHEGDGDALTIPEFVSIIGAGRDTTYYEDTASANNTGCILIPATSQAVSIKNMSLQVSGSTRGSCIQLTDVGTNVFTTGQYLVFDNIGIHATGASEDGIWKLSTSKNVIDSVKINNMVSTGYYDSVYLGNTVRSEVTNSECVAVNSDEDLPQCISITGNSLVNSDHRVQNNILRAYNASTAFSAATIGVKISASTHGTKNTYVMVANNQIECFGELNSTDIPTLESTCSGIFIEESGISVGDLVVHSSNNIYDCSGARLNRAIYSGASGKAFSCNDRNKDGTAISTATGSGGTVTIVL